MKKKRLASILLACAMVTATIAGCGNSASTTAPAETQQKDEENAGGTEAAGEAAADTASASDKDLMTIEIYDVAANYQGVQSGWFAQIVKEKFNLELNIIAPQVAGDAVFQTRASTGNLGDIVDRKSVV